MKTDQILYVLESFYSNVTYLTKEIDKETLSVIGIVKSTNCKPCTILDMAIGNKWRRDANMIEVREATEEEIATALMNSL